jgi:hypothetical protein
MKDFISIRIGEDAFEGNPRKALQVVGEAAINLERAFVQHLNVIYRGTTRDAPHPFTALCLAVQGGRSDTGEYDEGASYKNG